MQSLRIPRGEEDPAEQEAWLQSPGSLSQTQAPLTATPWPRAPLNASLSRRYNDSITHHLRSATGGAGESHPKATARFSEDLSSVPSTWGYNPSSSLKTHI